MNPPHLMECVTKVETVNISYEWKIENFSLHNMKNGESFTSPIFKTPNNDNLKWFIKLYPNGNVKDFTNYVSVFLHIHTEKPNHKVRFEFSILDKNKTKTQNLASEHLFVTNNGRGYPRFMENKFLFQEKASYLPNDSLTICCDFSVGLNKNTFVTKTDRSKRFKSDQFDEQFKEEKQICKDLDNLLKKEEFTDVLLITSTKQLKAHKYILAARSPVFLAMFSNNMLEKLQREIKITDYDCEVVSEMLEFIYTGTVKNIEKNAMSLLSIADKYEIKGLKNLCENFLNNSMSIESAIDLLILADRHNFQDFKTKVIKFILDHKKEITKTPKFDDLKIMPNLIADLFCSES